MKSTTLKAWTRWLLFVFLCACMLVQLGCTKVQALSVFHKAEESPSSIINQGKEKAINILNTVEIDKIKSSDVNGGSSLENEGIIKTSQIQTTDLTKNLEPGFVYEWVKITITAGIYGTGFYDTGIYRTGISMNTETKLEDKNTKSQESSQLEEETEETSSAILMFTGDLMCLGGQQNAVNHQGEFDFTHSFSYVAPLFDGADVVVGNLETLISPSNPYTYKVKTKNNNPNCNAMESYLEAVVYAGFDAVVTANNHSLDGNVIGIKETITNLDKYNLVHTGTFRNSTEQPFILYEVNGITVAILSYTELINARSSLPTDQVESYISCYSQAKVINDVKEAKKSGADYIVAYNHWGVENTHNVTKLQTQHATEMAEAGVDLILGSHPHCLQEAAYIQTSDGRQVLCVYSMGNFVSSMTREINTDTIVLEVNLRRNQETVYTGAIGYYPMKVIGSYESMRYVVLPVSSKLNGNSKLQSTLEQARIRIQKVIGNEIAQIRF